jgi:hypothetical protein
MLQFAVFRAGRDVKERHMLTVLKRSRVVLKVTLQGTAEPCGFLARPFVRRCAAAVPTQDKHTPADRVSWPAIGAALRAGECVL